jgi:DNA mismatch endonuclease, patch repair protein
MSRIRSSGTKLEKRFESEARKARVSLSRAPALFGKPDFKARGNALIFVNSCFWHGCKDHCRVPRTRTGYWKTKFMGNIARQERVMRALRRQGFHVFCIWEHDFGTQRLQSKLRRIRAIARCR